MALVAQHAYGRAAAVEKRVMTDVLEAVKAAGLRRLIIYPNTDRGHTGIVQAIHRHKRSCKADEVEVVRSLPRDDYLRALLRADVLIGNSSSGIIEAPLAGTPSVDVGQRQTGREPGGTSVVYARESKHSIRTGLHQALQKRPRRGGRSVYGDGQAGRRIAKLLSNLHLSEQLFKKQITY